MPHDAMGDLDEPAAQIPLSSDLIQRLGRYAPDYGKALWSVAQQRDADAHEMAALISAVNERFDVEIPDTVINKWQEIFRNSGGLVTIISEDRVIAGAPPGAEALEQPDASDGPDIVDE